MRTMTEGQRSYEAKRAAKAGMTLDKWLAEKARAEALESRQREREAAGARRLDPGAASDKSGKRGLLSRLIERGHKPL